MHTGPGTATSMLLIARKKYQRKIFTDQFSGPGIEQSIPCVCVCLSELFDLDI